MIFPVPMRLECAVLACSGVMGPETNLRLLAQINWWNRQLILHRRFFRWSVGSNLRARPTRRKPNPERADLATDLAGHGRVVIAAKLATIVRATFTAWSA